MRAWSNKRLLVPLSVVLAVLLVAVTAVAEPLEGPHDRVRDRRAAGVFGAAVGGQAALLIPALLAVGVAGDFTDRANNVGFGVMLGISPLVSSALGYVVADGSRAYEPSFSSMIVGGYIGSVLAMTGVVLFTELDDPKADGRYDGSYFDGNDGDQWGVLALGFAPLLLPAIGITIAYQIGRSRRPERRQDRPVALQIPTPLLIRENTKAKSYAPGIQLVSMTF